MIVSYHWLQTYFDKPLPKPEELGDLLTFHAFEIESIEKKKRVSGADDTIIDVKVLPDRACYALSHRGIAGEIGAILNIKAGDAPKEVLIVKDVTVAADVAEVAVKNEQPDLCRRYMARRINGVTVAPSPAWLIDMLEVIGQRSINTIVDVGNAVMFDCGQPLHAFDADKVNGGITVRLAREGEKMTTLDGKELALKPDMLVIADDQGVLALAGVKGGTKAEITSATKNIIIEAAQFKGSSVRRTSTSVGIRNDSSKRFENEISPELAARAMDCVSKLITLVSPQAASGAITDIYPKPAACAAIDVTPAFISQRLGVTLSGAEIAGYLKRLSIEVTEKEDTLHVTVPFERLDLNLPEDIVEEVGRLYGYEKIPEKTPAIVSTNAGKSQTEILKSFYYAEKVRAILSDLGFSEIYTPSLVKKGEVAIQNPLASDKGALRADLTQNLVKSLELNSHNAPLLGLEQIKVFEIGATFGKGMTEHTSLVVGIKNIKGYKGETVNEQIRQAREALLAAIDESATSSVTTLCTVDDSGGIIALSGKQIGIINNTDGVMELDLSALIAKLPEPKTWDIEPVKTSDKKYAPISQYPFVLRDIAVFVGEGSTEKDVREVISSKGGELLMSARLFDVFAKKQADGTTKTSYAFSLVFQSQKKTLAEADINGIMKSIGGEMTARGWQVR